MIPRGLVVYLQGSSSSCRVSAKIWADAAYRGQELAEWCQATGDWKLEVVERPSGTHGFNVVPRRWVVERTFSWISRNRRMSKDYERKVQTSETLIQVAMIRLLLARLGRKNAPVPKHPHSGVDCFQ